MEDHDRLEIENQVEDKNPQETGQEKREEEASLGEQDVKSKPKAKKVKAKTEKQKLDAPVAEKTPSKAVIVEAPQREVKASPEQSRVTEVSSETEEDRAPRERKALPEDERLIMPDRVQVKASRIEVEDSKDKSFDEEEFNPNLFKIKVGGTAAGVLSEGNSGIARALEGAQLRVGETQRVVTQVIRPTQLPVAALKIRNIVGEIQRVTAEVIKDKVIVQGVIHKQVFFVGFDGVVRHFAENVPFSTFIEIPGAEPGMNVQVHPVIEKILFHLSEDRLFVIQKIIVEIFVKVTQFVQVSLELGQGPLLLLDMVVGEGIKQTLVENLTPLGVPAVKIDEIRGDLRQIQAEIIPDKVVIQGVIHKQIFFVDTDNLARHQAEEVPFSLFIDVPGATPGMDLQVHPRIEGIFFELVSPTVLREKVVIEVFVKVTEAVQEMVSLSEGNLFKVEQVIGEAETQILKEAVIGLNRPTIKIREILGEVRDVTAQVIPDKVVVQGVIHKQIFFIGTDNIEYHQAEDLPFSLFVDLPGAVPGLNARVRTTIEKILFELVDDQTLRQKVVLKANVVVTETVQLQLALGAFSLFKLEQVIGEGIRQILVERREEVPPVIVRNVVVAEIVQPAGVITGRQQIIVENVIELPEIAVKIKEVRGVITDLRARALAPNGVLIDGFVNKEVFFVGEDGVVRSLTERIPFSILVSVPGISPESPFSVDISIENISFTLSPDGRFLRQIIVISAEVTAETPAPEPFQVVIDVTGPGIITKKVRVRAPVLTETGVEVQEFDVVTEVSGPGIARVEKRVVMLDIVGDDNPNPVPIEVVTNVVFEPVRF